MAVTSSAGDAGDAAICPGADGSGDAQSHSLAYGRAFAAIVDLRAGQWFGWVETFELHPGNALFVPRGCGNSYQTLTPDVMYSYLVNAHWSSGASYTLVQAFDPALGSSSVTPGPGAGRPMTASARTLSPLHRHPSSGEPSGWVPHSRWVSTARCLGTQLRAAAATAAPTMGASR